MIFSDRTRPLANTLTNLTDQRLGSLFFNPSYFTTIEADGDNDRNELLHLIETIPTIEISQFPEENFLHQAFSNFQNYQL